MIEICTKLNIPHYTVNFSSSYWHDVFVPFLDTYSGGRMTPNPGQCSCVVV